MENIIENGAVTETENQVAEAGGQQEMMEGSVVTLSEILSEARDSDAGSPAAGGKDAVNETVANQEDDAPVQQQPEPATAAQPQTVFRTQAEFDAAFSKRMANERSRNRPYVEMGQAVMDVAGNELTSAEVQEAISHALAEKRSRVNHTDYDTERNNIRVEQRVAQRFAPRNVPSPHNTPQPAENSRARAQEMMAAMSAIGDGAFNVAALQGNPEAMNAWVGGATPAEVYRTYFAGAPQRAPQQPQPQTQNVKRPAPERAANSGPMGTPRRALSDADLDKIDAMVEAGRSVSLI